MRALHSAALVALCACNHPTVEATPPPAALDLDNRDSMTLRAELFVEDVATSAAFYTGVLGFELDEDGADYAVARAGTVRFGLGRKQDLGSDHYFNPELQTDRVGLGTEIVLEVDDVENYAAAVEQAGWPILTPLTTREWGLTDFRVADPDGYYLRITSR